MPIRVGEVLSIRSTVRASTRFVERRSGALLTFNVIPLSGRALKRCGARGDWHVTEARQR